MSTISLLFFDISSGEIIIILLVVFIVFGPGKIPELAKKIGRGVYEIKKASAEIKREIDAEVRKTEKNLDAGLSTKKKNRKPENLTDKTNK